MSRKACLLTTNDVPQYIREIAARLSPVMLDYKDKEGNSWWGYTFRLNAKWKCGYEGQLQNDAEKLVHWCKGWYAHAEVIEYHYWNDGISPYQTYHSLERKRWREGFRNHAFLVISDPVANRFEKDKFYKDKQYDGSKRVLREL